MPPKTPYEPWPLDFAILELLPSTGLIAGIHWKGRRVRDIASEINETLPPEARVSTAEVGTRVRVMALYDLARMHAATGGKIWSRTPGGEMVLAKKADYLGHVAEVPSPDNPTQAPEGAKEENR